MKVGIPKEIKNNENRVGMTPAGVAELTRHGHEVSVQHTAGEGSGFSDDDYIKAGARILPTIEAVVLCGPDSWAMRLLEMSTDDFDRLVLPFRLGGHCADG